VVVVDEVHEQDRFVERVAAIDVGKDELKVCVRVAGDRPGTRRQQVRTYPTRTAAILLLSDWLRCERVELVVMEATGNYWKPPFYLLEDEFTCWLLDARQVKHLPGRPKSDLLTELGDRSFEGCVQRPGVLARFRPRDQRRGCAA
jgi:transposase